MRLLYFDKDGELSLTKDLIDNVPPYAILSHTWGADEVTFPDLQSGNYKSMIGYTKIHFCGQQAQKDGVDYFWVDTCCIDKANQSELTEAIVSMFRWYSNAARCYVFLSDVRARKRDREGNQMFQESAFRGSRWFTRGWTLQELLAPGIVEFFSSDGQRLGDRGTLRQTIHEITTIPKEALCGGPLIQFPVAERLRWAEKRTTTRAEDKAYCLLGIFNVFIPPIYGEGENAFNRLKDEISRSYRRQLDEVAQLSLTLRPVETEKHNLNPVSVQADNASLLERRKILLASLSFDQMDARRSTIKNAYSTTCQWLLKHSAYVEWVDTKEVHKHHGFLWINGKPGAGKSTLIKFAYAHAEEQRPEHEILVSFFFNARGDELERSTIGLYRALLYQLLDRAPDLQTLLDDLIPVHEDQGKASMWTIESLCELLSAAVSRLGQRRLKCFVDALDECDEQQVQDMVYFFEKLGHCALDTGNQLSICFASRHYPTIDIQSCRRLILEDEDDHVDDLVKYIRSHLRAGEGTYIEEVRKQVQEKANGVFMWAVLVVDILNKEFLRGRIFAVKQRLQEIPAKLSDLFKDILRRDCANMSDLLLCLQWLLFAKRPLTREEFYFAMVAGLDSSCGDITEWEVEHTTTDDMRRFVLNSSKGLAELTKSKSPTVQFIHESVRDFLIKDNGLRELWPDLESDVYSLSHDQLKRCCRNYLRVETSAYLPSGPLPKSFSTTAKELRMTLAAKFPFLNYAHGHILYHADEAATSIAQDDFLRKWPIQTWINIGNLFAKGDVRRHTPNASTLYLLAEYGFARLIRTLCKNGPTMGARGERYHYPLFAALANNHPEAVRALLSKDGDFSVQHAVEQLEFGKDFSVRKDHTPLLWALEMKHEGAAEILATFTDADVNGCNKNGQDPLSIAAECGFKNVVSLLLERCKSPLHDPDDRMLLYHRKTPLYYAAEQGHTEVVRQLLQFGVDVEANTIDHGTILHGAASNGHDTIVQLLLGHGARISATNFENGTALHCAADNGHDTTVQLLLDKGAGIEAVDDSGMTALHIAARKGHESVVKLLLERDAHIAAVDKIGRTTLDCAAGNGRDATVRLLLDMGANIQAINRATGQTALHKAAVNGHETTVQLLLKSGIDVEVKDNYGRTPLYLAVLSGHRATVELLLASGADTEAVDYTDRTVLHKAAAEGFTVGVQLLVDGGANIEARDRDGRTPLSYAAENWNKGVMHLLLARNANYDVKDNTGRTPLLWAVGLRPSISPDVPALVDRISERASAIADHHMQMMLPEQQEKRISRIARQDLQAETPSTMEEVVKLLLIRAINIQAADGQGKTALQWTTQRVMRGVVDLLLEEGFADIDEAPEHGGTANDSSLK